LVEILAPALKHFSSGKPKEMLEELEKILS